MTSCSVMPMQKRRIDTGRQSQMDVLPVLEFLRLGIGLNPASVGTESVERSVRERVESSGAANAQEYVEIIEQNKTELDALIESVLIRETSFFRNHTPFIALRDYLRRFVLNKNRNEPLRILCVPCSTGEEAYSIAMVLLDMGLTSDQFSISAIDISETCLQVARNGVYREYSFRGEQLRFREKYFLTQPNGTYLLKREVRDAVHFERANILDENFQPEHENYDVIFCRNLLIYFDAFAKQTAIRTLDRYLSDRGVLFVGHAEGTAISHQGFVGLNFPKSFAYARKDYATEINDSLGTVPAIEPVKPMFPEKFSRSSVSTARNNNENYGKHPPISVQVPLAGRTEIDISAARRMADAGLYEEAQAACMKLLDKDPESAEVYFLLGQVAGSMDDYLRAEENLTKAIYLNADFHDALVYLSIIAERMGQSEKAANYRARALRVQQRGKK